MVPIRFVSGPHCFQYSKYVLFPIFGFLDVGNLACIWCRFQDVACLSNINDLYDVSFDSLSRERSFDLHFRAASIALAYGLWRGACSAAQV